MAAIQGGFLANLGRIYALYTGTFIGFTIFIGLLGMDLTTSRKPQDSH